MIKNAPELTVDKTIRINAPREHVFKLLSDPKEIKRWKPMTSFEPRVGGHYQFEKGEWIAVGEIVEFDPPRVVAYTWDWKNSPLGTRTVVKYELQADGDATIVRLTHTGFTDAERAKAHGEGWEHYGQRLKIAAEGGDPGPDTMDD
jgi:uncharacterized protein YndB with AHSA1/START domain